MFIKVTAVGVIALLMLPVLWTLLISLASDPDALLEGELDLTLQNYVDLFKSESLNFPRHLLNSLIVSSLSAFLSTLLSTLTAYSIGRSGFRWSGVILTLFLGISLIPQISIAGYLFKIFSSLGLINTYGSLVLSHATLSLPLGIWIMHTYLSTIPREIEKSAYIDGAGSLRILFQIILPLSLPGIVTTFITLFLFSFNEFLFALMFTIDHTARTVTVGIALFEGLHGQIPWGYITSASLVSVLPAVIVVLIMQRHLVRGLTAGAVKG